MSKNPLKRHDEELAANRVYEFCFIALPLKIQVTTGSMIDPVAVI